MLQFQVEEPTMSVSVQSERKVNNPKCFCFFQSCISDDNISVFVFGGWTKKKSCDVMIEYRLISIPYNFFFHDSIGFVSPA